jgi:hypothetical protein
VALPFVGRYGLLPGACAAVLKPGGVLFSATVSLLAHATSRWWTPTELLVATAENLASVSLCKPSGGFLSMLESTWEAHPWVESGRGRPRFALHAGPYADWPRFVDLIQRAESCGFDAHWMVDHPLRRPGCWTTLAGLATVTRNIRLGTLVNCVLYRSAFEVARQSADVDRMSNGRVILGVGAGDDELECRQLGISMPPARERVRLLGEMIQSVKELWGETNPRPSGGSGHQLQPGPVQSPRILGPSTTAVSGH